MADMRRVSWEGPAGAKCAAADGFITNRYDGIIRLAAAMHKHWYFFFVNGTLFTHTNTRNKYLVVNRIFS